MKLYTLPGSPNGRKVRAVIEHLGLDVSVEPLSFKAGDLRRPVYTALNANMLAPTLVDGDFVLWESNAIAQYLADKAGNDALFPRDLKKRADVVRWQFWELAHFNKAFGTLAFETVAKKALEIGPPNENLVSEAKRSLERFAPVLEAHLAGRHVLVGNGITLADYSVSCLEAYRTLVPFDWSRFPNINAYFDRIHVSEHWARTASPTQATAAKAA